MAGPELEFYIDKTKLSNVEGYDYLRVAFQAHSDYDLFECRATKVEDAWGVGMGTLIASFSDTPANRWREFEIYNSYIWNGDGDYRITLLARNSDGEWNVETVTLSAFEFPFSNGLEGPELQMGTIQNEDDGTSDNEDHIWKCLLHVIIHDGVQYDRVVCSYEIRPGEIIYIEPNNIIDVDNGIGYEFILNEDGPWYFEVYNGEEPIYDQSFEVSFGIDTSLRLDVHPEE